MSKPNQHGVYPHETCEIVNLPINKKYITAKISVAQDDDDKLFRFGLDFGTPTSGFGYGAYQFGKTFKTREEAIRNGIKTIIDKVPGYEELIAKSKYANLLAEETQLSLF